MAADLCSISDKDGSSLEERQIFVQFILHNP